MIDLVLGDIEFKIIYHSNELKSNMNYSVRYEFHGDYVGIRRHTTLKNTIRKNGLRKLGRYVVFGAIVNKIHMSSEEVLFSLKSKC